MERPADALERAAPRAAAGPGLLPRVLFAVLKSARRFWPLVLVWLGVVGGATLYVGNKYGKQSYKTSTTLVYSPLPAPEIVAGSFPSSDIKTLAQLVLSRPNLDVIRREFNLPVPHKLLEKLFSVEAPTGTKALNISFEWSEPKGGAAMLSRLSEAFRQQVVELRREKLATMLKDLDEQSRQRRQKLAQVETAMRAKTRGMTAADVKRELDSISSEMLQLDVAYNTAERTLNNQKNQLATLNKQLQVQRAEQAKEDETAKKFEAADESISENRRRQDRLRELIDEERTLVATKAQLNEKRADFERALELYRKRAGPLKDVEKLKAEMTTIASRIQENEKITAWKAEMARIDKVVVPKGQKKSMGSPIIAQILAHQLDLELGLVGGTSDLKQLVESKRLKETRVEELNRMKQEVGALERDIERAAMEVQKVDEMAATLRQMSSIGPAELVVAAPPTVSEVVSSSNKKMLYAGTAGGGIGVLLAVLAVMGLRADRLGAALSVAGKLQLPVLSTFDNPSPEAIRTRARSLVVRLQQRAPRAGSVFLFVGVRENLRAPKWIADVLDRWAKREQRVLHVDLSPGEAANGLMDALARRGTPTVEESDRRASVTTIVAGGTDEDRDLLASPAMADWVAAARKAYDVVLVDGLSLADSSDLLAVAPYADAVVMVAGTSSPTSVGRQTFDEMSAMDVPMAGAVVVV